jgi:DDE superfamily endonuclease
MADWSAALTDWLNPFVEKLGHKKRREMRPLYVAGLIGAGERKSIEPMAARMAPVLHHEIHVMQGARYQGFTGLVAAFFAVQWTFAILAPSGNGLPLPGTAIAQDRFDHVSILTNGDNLPILLSPELREGEPARICKAYLSCAARPIPPSAASGVTAATVD